MRNITLRCFLLAFFTSLCYPTCANAQGVEEAVIFMLYGEYAGTPTDGYSLKETSKNRWEIRKGEVRIGISKIGNCRFTLENRDGNDKLLVIRNVDFTGWRDQKLERLFNSPSHYTLTFLGATEKRTFVESGQEDITDHISELFTNENVYRAERAASYFRATHCKGRAF